MSFQPLRSPAFSAETNAVSIGSGRFVVRCELPMMLVLCNLSTALTEKGLILCCLGSQRAVLVPVLRAIGSKVVIAQTRRSDFVEACKHAQGTYEVDIFREDGSKQTDLVEVEGRRRWHEEALVVRGACGSQLC